MWENIIYIIVGGVMTLLGSFVGGLYGHLKWKRQTQIDLWKEKKDKLDRILTPDFFQCVLEGSFDSKVVSDITLVEESDQLLDIFYEHLDRTENQEFTSEQRNMLVSDLKKHVQAEKAKYDEEIKKILNSWF